MKSEENDHRKWDAYSRRLVLLDLTAAVTEYRLADMF